MFDDVAGRREHLRASASSGCSNTKDGLAAGRTLPMLRPAGMEPCNVQTLSKSDRRASTKLGVLDCGGHKLLKLSRGKWMLCAVSGQ